jgi:hypothetical protein
MLASFFSILVALFAQDEPKPPYEATVTVKETRIRETARSTGKTVAILTVRQKVQVLEHSGSWARVKGLDGDAKDKEGWVTRAALLDTPTFVSKEEAAGGDPAKGAEAAGYTKGFDPQTEKEFRASENLNAEYDKIDKIEKSPFRSDGALREQALADFRKGGALGEFRK